MCLHKRILSCITKTLSSILWFVSSHYFLLFLPEVLTALKMHGTLYISLYKGHKRETGLSYWITHNTTERNATKTEANVKRCSHFNRPVQFENSYLKTSVLFLQSRYTPVLLSFKALHSLVKRSSALFFPRCTAISLFWFLPLLCVIFLLFGWMEGLSSHRLLLSCNVGFQLISICSHPRIFFIINEKVRKCKLS